MLAVLNDFRCISVLCKSETLKFSKKLEEFKKIYIQERKAPSSCTLVYSHENIITV